ncbi:hypothetical protein B7Z17_01625 [Candidatus Saccharibacteria bacterium 32-49-10]|nr:MAG: hypothetical protein B7Z17_01625 [Candidatus Saccharibacteria bacterium 32-49-10]
MGRKEHGFTILEVILFLAVSSLLFVMIFGSINSTLRNTRFTSSVKSLNEFIRAKYVSVQTGGFMKDVTSANVPVCNASGSPSSSVSTTQGRSDTCLAVGVLLDFGDPIGDSIWSYPLLAYTADIPSTSSAASALKLSNVRMYASGNTDKYTLDWGGRFTSIKKMITPNVTTNSDRSRPVRYIAFIRDIQSEAINTYAYNSATELLTSPASMIAADTMNPSLYRNVPIMLCFSSQDASAEMRGIVKLKGNGTGRGYNVGNITSTVDKKTNPQFRDVMSVAPFNGYSGGYTGMLCD